MSKGALPLNSSTKESFFASAQKASFKKVSLENMRTRFFVTLLSGT
jgi:hypothetical protein